MSILPSAFEGSFSLERTGNSRRFSVFLAYGGLRGAVAFSLVIMLDETDHKNLFITATLFIILFTVFVQVSSPLHCVLLLDSTATFKKFRTYSVTDTGGTCLLGVSFEVTTLYNARCTLADLCR
ncbi:hypothetical protein AVEN_113603-1 [Araneus ventricosus]|uniref:Uncharacterized protein n=1 Tax=Araneus ventricosus TaxID=182803 RepID=A0A4Y2M3X0_ARAVE|nr:hypothetical protein AVEN_113603-1 [Araneus ventricosus]